MSALCILEMDAGDIRTREVVALETQRFAGSPAQCVGETVSEIQPGGTPAFSPPEECTPRMFRLLGVECHNLDPSARDHQIELASSVRPETSLDYQCSFQKRTGR